MTAPHTGKLDFGSEFLWGEWVNRWNNEKTVTGRIHLLETVSLVGLKNGVVDASARSIFLCDMADGHLDALQDQGMGQIRAKAFEQLCTWEFKPGRRELFTAKFRSIEVIQRQLDFFYEAGGRLRQGGGVKNAFLDDPNHAIARDYCRELCLWVFVQPITRIDNGYDKQKLIAMRPQAVKILNSLGRDALTDLMPNCELAKLADYRPSWSLFDRSVITALEEIALKHASSVEQAAIEGVAAGQILMTVAGVQILLTDRDDRAERQKAEPRLPLQ